MTGIILKDSNIKPVTVKGKSYLEPMEPPVHSSEYMENYKKLGLNEKMPIAVESRTNKVWNMDYTSLTVRTAVGLQSKTSKTSTIKSSPQH